MSRINLSDLMFNAEDVRTTRQLLPRLARIAFFRLSLTNNEYLERFNRFFKDRFPEKTIKDFRQQATAVRKALNDNNKLTFNMLRGVLEAMGYDIEAVEIRAKERLGGAIYTFSTDETAEEIEAKLNEEKQVGISSIF